MKVGFDYIQMYPGKIGGMEQFVRNIILFLKDYTNTEIFVFVTDQNKDYFSKYDEIKTIYIKRSENIVRETQLIIAQSDLDVIICPFTIVETKISDKLIVSFFPDTQCYDFPHFFDKENLHARLKNFEEAAQFSDLMVTISEFSRNSIIKHLNMEPEKVKYIHLNSDKVFENPIEENKNNEIRKKYGLPEKYIFYPANTWAHKNHINLIKAYKIFSQKDQNQTIKLVFTGDLNNHSQKLKKLIQKYDLQECIYFLGYIDQEDMPYIYSNALYMIFPSYYEGFGIPLVEAMRSNCAVTCSNVGSLPEIGKDAVLYFDPNDINEMESAMTKMLDQEVRNALCTRGIEVVSSFSWENSAKELFGYLEEAINRINQNQTTPLVSIITPSYNQGMFIEETILSVINQTYKNIEYIVMDGGSTDNTIEVLEKYSSKLTWVSEKDGGQADAVHRGILKAKGTIIGWLNSDDTYYPQAIETMVKYFSKYPDCKVIYGEADYIDKESRFIEKYPTFLYDKNTIAEMCYICQPATFFKRDIYLSVGGLDTNLQMCMDYDLWLRLSKFFDLTYIYNTISTSRLYKENKTLGQRDKVYDEVINTVQKHYGYVPYKWIVGYVTYLSENFDISFFRKKILIIVEMLKYNWRKPIYIFKFLAFKIITLLRQIKKAYKFTGLYEDAWVGREYQSVLDFSAANRISIIGKNEGVIKKGLTINLYINDEKISTTPVNIGDFETTTIIDKKYQVKNANFTIRPNKSFIPLLRLKPDYRVLSFKLTDIRIKWDSDNEPL